MNHVKCTGREPSLTGIASILDNRIKCEGAGVKNVSISLTDQHAAAIEAELASDYASVSEVVRAALREFLDKPVGPGLDQIDADIARYQKGAKLADRDEARRRIRAAIPE